MNSLIIETSTDKGVIAYIKDRQVVFTQEFICGQNQSRLLMPYLAACIDTHKIQAASLDCIGIGVGPGSYTGIRVGVSVAQTLALSWNLPLIEISSLNGFVPQKETSLYAAIVDARIAGAYVQKGIKHPHEQFAEPKVCLLENLLEWLGEVDYLVTPNSQSLQIKLARIYPNKQWQWEERFPSVSALATYVELAYIQGRIKQPEELAILYLRDTLAERQRELKLNLESKKSHF